MSAISKKFKIFSKKSHYQFNKEGRVYILPTRFGLSFFFINFISFVIALAFGHQFSYLFSISLLVIFVMCAFLSNQYLKNLELGEVEPFVVTPEGHELKIPLHLKNTQEKIIDLEASYLQQSQLFTSTDQEITSSFRISLNKVGVYRGINIRLDSTFPLMLFNTWMYHKLSSTLIVYPAHGGQNSIVEDDRRGPVHDIEYKKFSPGDKLNRVDWKIYARKNELIVKEDLDLDSSFNILDERIIPKHGQAGLGTICHAINHHISTNKSFIFKSVNGREIHVSKKIKKFQLMERLVEEYS